MVSLQELSFAPEVAGLPLHTSEELADLVSSMRSNGYLKQFPIIAHDRLIYDGRNRYLAALEAEVEPYYIHCKTKEEALTLAESSYLQRVYTLDQKIQVKAHFANLKQGNPRGLMRSGANYKTTEQLADESGVSLSKMKKTVAIKNAVEDGRACSEVRDRVIQGKDTNNAAYEAINLADLHVSTTSPTADQDNRNKMVHVLTEEAVKLANESDITIIRAMNVLLGNKTVVNCHTIGDNDSEWYTPIDITDRARNVMGSIDTDPATNDYAQTRIQAKVFFTKDMNGLNKPWLGNVWLNPPYGKETKEEAGCSTFIDYLLKEVSKENVHQYLVLVNTSNGTGWYESMMEHCSAFGLSRDRIQFDKHPDASEDKKDQNTKGQTLFYFGPNIEDFYVQYDDLFNVAIPINATSVGVLFGS